MPAMPKAHANGAEIEYETVGDPAGRPLLLVQGLGAQLTSVEDGLCQELASRGFLVIRYDNRDAGLSTWFDDAGPVNLASTTRRSPTPSRTWPTTPPGCWTRPGSRPPTSPASRSGA